MYSILFSSEYISVLFVDTSAESAFEFSLSPMYIILLAFSKRSEKSFAHSSFQFL